MMQVQFSPISNWKTKKVSYFSESIIIVFVVEEVVFEEGGEVFDPAIERKTTIASFLSYFPISHFQ